MKPPPLQICWQLMVSGFTFTFAGKICLRGELFSKLSSYNPANGLKLARRVTYGDNIGICWVGGRRRFQRNHHLIKKNEGLIRRPI